jgi:hypothetical protein
MNITIEGLEEGRFLEALTEEVAEKMHDQIETAIEEGIRPALERAVSRLADEALRPAVAAAIEEGWQPTDSYGRPNGPHQTLKDRLSAFLDTKNQWSDRTLIGSITREVIEAAYKADLNGEIAKLKEGFRKQVDEALQAKFRDALAESVGIKRE